MRDFVSYDVTRDGDGAVTIDIKGIDDPLLLPTIERLRRLNFAISDAATVEIRVRGAAIDKTLITERVREAGPDIVGTFSKIMTIPPFISNR